MSFGWLGPDKRERLPEKYQTKNSKPKSMVEHFREGSISFACSLETCPAAIRANLPACISVRNKAYLKHQRCSPCFGRGKAHEELDK